MRSLMIASGMAVLVGAGAMALAGTGNSFIGKKAPEIRPTDWIGGDGRTSLADFKGEVVMLEFWSTH